MDKQTKIVAAIRSRDEAKDRLEQHLGHDGAPSSMPRVLVEKAVPGATIGWSLPLPEDYLGKSRVLHLILPIHFPESPIQAFVHPSPFLKWPHAERDGRLCLWPESLAPVAISPSDQIDHCLTRIGEILELVRVDSDPDRRDAEFAREWLSYWTTDAGSTRRSQRPSLFVTVPPGVAAILKTCIVQDSQAKSGQLLFSSDLDALHRWRTALKDSKAAVSQEGALFVPLPKAPTGAPRSVDEVRLLIKDAPEALTIFEQFLSREEPTPFWIVFSVTEKLSTAVAALELIPAVPQSFRVVSRRDKKQKKERWSRVAAHSWRICIQPIKRADAVWIHGRGFDEEAAVLATKRITLIGCGSLGGLVAQSLAHAGIGHLTLVDPETLEPANLGRHVLGVDALGKSKANALARHLQNQLPHADVRPVPKHVQEYLSTDSIEDTDLVICTAAEWPCEWFTLSFMETQDIPLLISWAEPHAFAGHSAASSSGALGLKKLFNQRGESIRRRMIPRESEWPLPGCSASHQPGTFNRIQQIASLVAEHAVDILLDAASSSEHRIWLGDSAAMKRLGGSWITPPPSGTRASVIGLPIPCDE